MTDTLLVEGYAASDGWPTLTIGTPGTYLDEGFSFGALLLAEGSLDRYADRVFSIPVTITAGGRTALRTAVETLMRAFSRPYFKLTWTPDNAGVMGLPLVFDCQDAQVTPQWDTLLDTQGVRRLTVTFRAAPFGSSTVTTEPVAGATSTGTRFYAQTAENVKGTAPGLVTDVEIAGTNLRSSLLHATPAGRSANVPVALTAKAGSANDFVSGENVTLFDRNGTYAVWLSFASTVAGTTQLNRPSVRVDEYVNGTVGGTLIGTAYSSGAIDLVTASDLSPHFVDSRYYCAGTITLPAGRSLNATTSYKITTTIGGVGSIPVPQDVMFLHVDGTTIFRSRLASATPTRAYVGPPTHLADLNTVYESAGTTVSDFRTLTGTTTNYLGMSGPALSVHPAGNVLIAHSPFSAPTLTATYKPRFLSERTV